MANLTQCSRGGDEAGRPGWNIKFEYDQETVELLKKSIPHTHRAWYPVVKSWWVSEEYAGVLTKMFSNFDSLAYLQGTLF
jgi:hypothetical protein